VTDLPAWAVPCVQAIDVATFHYLDHGVYALESAGEVSLVTKQALLDWLRHRLQGGTNEVGGGTVGGA
jgi:hypothetical protein